MKNVENCQLKNCLFMKLEDYEKLVLNLTDGLLEVKCEVEGIFYEFTKKAEETETYWNEDIRKTLSRYFDVTVTSVLNDDCEGHGVWICYTEKKSEEKKFSVKLPNGYLTVEEKGTEDDYPGVYVSFSEDGKEYDRDNIIACVEYDTGSGEIKTETYINGQDDPTNIICWEDGRDLM